MLTPWKESYDQSRQHIKKQRHYFANKCPSSQSYGFSTSHVWMWELDYKENRALKNWCFWTVVLEKTLESPLDCKEIQPVHPKRNQSWIFIGRTDVEAEMPILWAPDVKSWLIWKDSDAGKDQRQENKGTTEVDPSPTWWTWVWVDSRSWWWTGNPGVLQSMGSQGVGHNWLTEPNWTETWFSQSGYSAVRIHLPMQETEFNPWVRKMPWRRKWQPSLVLYPGKSQGQRSLEG